MLRAVNTNTDSNESSTSKGMIESSQREVFELTQKHTQSLLLKESKIKDLE